MSKIPSPGRPPKKSPQGSGVFTSRHFTNQQPRLPTKEEFEKENSSSSQWSKFIASGPGKVTADQVKDQTWKMTGNFYGGSPKPPRTYSRGEWMEKKSVVPPLSAWKNPYASPLIQRPYSRGSALLTASHHSNRLSLSKKRNESLGNSSQVENSTKLSNLPPGDSPSRVGSCNMGITQSIDLTSTAQSSVEKLTVIEPHTIGFQNLGNTCYLAATLQTLVGLPNVVSEACHLRKQIEKTASSSSDNLASLPSLPIVSPFVELCHALQSGKDSRANKRLRELKADIAKVDKTFDGTQMQDANEFLGRLLDKMDDILEEEKLPNLVASNFGYEREEILKCCDCEEEESTRRKDVNFFLNLIGTVSQEAERTSLQGLIEKSLAKERRERKCEKCGGNEASSSSQLLTLPRVLLICLKRYNWGEELGGDKIAKKVDIPSVISLDRVSRQSCEMPAIAELNPLICNKENFSETSSSQVIYATPEKKELIDSRIKTPEKFKGKSNEEIQSMSEEDQVEFMMFTSEKEANALKLSEEEQLQLALTESVRSTEDSGFSSRVGTDNSSRKRVFTSDSPSNRPDPKRSRRELFNKVKNLSSENENVANVTASNNLDEEDQLKRALEESLEDSKSSLKESLQVRTTENHERSSLETLDTLDEDAQLKRALQESLVESNSSKFETTSELENAGMDSLDAQHKQALEDSLLDISVNNSVLDFSKNNNTPRSPELRAECPPEFLYALHSVVAHHGSGTSSGHYVADVVRYDQGGEWFRYDDTHVRPVKEEVVRRERNRENGYIFMYLHKPLSDKFKE